MCHTSILRKHAVESPSSCCLGRRVCPAQQGKIISMAGMYMHLHACVFKIILQSIDNFVLQPCRVYWSREPDEWELQMAQQEQERRAMAQQVIGECDIRCLSWNVG